MSNITANELKAEGVSIIETELEHQHHEQADAGFGECSEWVKGYLLSPGQLYEALRGQSESNHNTSL